MELVPIPNSNIYSRVKFKKPDRHIERVYIHCSASSNPDHGTIEQIEKWHKQRGFDEIGYHYLIPFDPKLLEGRDLEKTPAAQKGHNTGTIAICVHGLKIGDFNMGQITILKVLCEKIVKAFPDVTIHGHCEVSSKVCPVFDYRRLLGLDDEGRFISTIPAELDLFSSGQEVVILQQKLNKFLTENGFPGTDYLITVDGIFGQETRSAVLQFQMISGINPTGIVGPETRLALPIVSMDGEKLI